MTFHVRWRAIANEELHQAYTWYEEQREGLGEDFLLCLEAVLDAIRDNPQQFPVIHDQIRRALLRRFPYAIFYTVHGDLITVLAVFHGKRRPKRFTNG